MALDFSDYDGCVAAIADTLNREDLTDQIPGWIVLAEERHKTDLRIRETIARLSVEIDDRFLDLPTGFLEMKMMRVSITDGGDPFTMTEVTPDQMTSLRRSTAVGTSVWAPPTGRPANMPSYFSIDGEIEFDVDPSEYTDDNPFAEMRYYKAVTPISSSNDSNAILVRSPGSYFYGSLVHSAPFLLNDERIPTWESAYQEIVAKLNANDRKRSGQLIARVSGRTP